MKRISLVSVVSLLLIMGLLSCSTLNRHKSSGYYGSDYNQDIDAPHRVFQIEQENFERSKAIEDLGLQNSRQLSESEQIALEQRLYLAKLESQLQTKQEKKQYYTYKAFFPNDYARISFLSLPTIEARKRLAISLGLEGENDSGYSTSMAKIIEDNEIVVGMSQKAVTESWGDPDLIEVAGNSIYRNERWKYSKYVTSDDGYKKENRIIYFEGGKVVGWESL